MPNKKITVVGDGVEEPLTPEEEHRLEVRVDKMLDFNLPDDLSPADKEAETEPETAVDSTAVEQPTAVAPKVIKIIPTFHDDEPLVVSNSPKPTSEKFEVTKLAPELSSEAIVEQKKRVAKKTAVVNHAETDVPVKPKNPTEKRSKLKGTTEKPKKRLSIAIADNSETDDLASKADAISALALAAEQQLVAANEVPELAAEVASVGDFNQSETATEVTKNGAPPLIKKHAAAPIGIAEDALEPEAPKLQPISKNIAIVHDDAAVPTGIEAIVPEIDVLGESKKTVTKISINEVPEEVETIDVAVEPDTAPDIAESPKTQVTNETKYRPPDGPMEFKRADIPIQPHKPGEPRSEELSANELSEDEAIAQAFETKEPGDGSRLRQLKGSLLKVLKWTILLVLIAGIVSAGAIPNLRHKVLGFVGLRKTTTASSAKPVAVPKLAATTDTSQDVYLAKRAGVYNLYRVAISGQSEQLVLIGTGNETADTTVATNPTSELAALVSTRDGKKNNSGEIQQSLAVVSVASGAINSIDTADKIKLVDWYGDRLVYVLFSSSTSTSDTSRYQIISYNTATKIRTVLDHASYLNDVLSAKGTVYYATGASGGASQFVSIKPDGTVKQVILSAEIVAITRTDYDHLTLASVSKWYSYKLGATTAAQTNNVSQVGRQYVDSPSGKQSVYVAKSGALTLLDTTTGKETTLAATSSYPIHWLSNDTLVYRSENADFLQKTTGGQSTKITDVSDLPGITLWHE